MTRHKGTSILPTVRLSAHPLGPETMALYSPRWVLNCRGGGFTHVYTPTIHQAFFSATSMGIGKEYAARAHSSGNAMPFAARHFPHSSGAGLPMPGTAAFYSNKRNCKTQGHSPPTRSTTGLKKSPRKPRAFPLPVPLLLRSPCVSGYL